MLVQGVTCNYEGRRCCCTVSSCVHKCTHSTYRGKFKSESGVSQVSVVRLLPSSASSSTSSRHCLTQAPLGITSTLWKGSKLHTIFMFSVHSTLEVSLMTSLITFYPIQLALSKLVISLPNCILFF